MNILVSACLLGIRCRYDGSEVGINGLKEAFPKDNFIPVCPELLGGLTTPRSPAERVDDKIFTKTGEDVTKEYTLGAKEVLKLAQINECQFAILKERSPSCGCGKIYNGTFTGKLIDGNGITAEILLEHGIKVVGENNNKNIKK
jgi:uncharacterized protein YbbK (DUF523 family)